MSVACSVALSSCLLTLAPIGHAQSSDDEEARELCEGLSSGTVSPEDAHAVLDQLGPEEVDLASAIHDCAQELARTWAADPAKTSECRELLLLAFEATSITEDWTQRARRVYELSAYLVAAGERDRLRTLVEDALSRLPTAHSMQSRLHAVLAQLAAYGRDWDRALAELSAAEEVVAGDPNPEVFRAELAGLRGDFYLQMGLLDLARRWILAQRDAVRSLTAPPEVLQAGLDVHLANLRLACEDWETLVLEVDDALASRGAGSAEHSARAELLVRQGIALASLERLDPARTPRAEAVLESVLALGEAVPAHERHSARTRLVELCLEQRRMEEAGELLAELARDASTEKAEPVASLDEAYRAALETRWARESGQPPDRMASARAALQQAFERHFAEWSEVELRPGGVGFLKYGRVRIVVSELIECALGPGLVPNVTAPDDHARREALEIVLRAESVSTLARQLGSTAATVDALRRELLGPGEGLLVYFPSRWNTHVFALDHEGLLHERLPPDETIDPARRALLDVVMEPPSGSAEDLARRRTEIEAAARSLSAALLPPAVLGRLEGWRTVTLVSTDLLGYLPFECLGLERGAPLGLERAVGYLSSCSVGLGLVRRGSRERSVPRDCLLVAAPLQDADLPDEYRGLAPLPFGAEERARLVGAYLPEKVEVLAEADARFDRMRDALEGTRLLHLLVHGVQNPELERTAGLLLSPTSENGASDHGLVWIDRLETLERVPDVVLATACGAGRGPDRSGDTASAHLEGVFLRQGASAVLLPQAALSYPATLELSAHFHDALARGAGVAEALHQARVRLSEDPRHADPYYWSLLHVRGLPGFVAFPADPGAESERGISSAMLLGSLGALGGLGLGWLYWRRSRRSTA